jgi:hypothetical protein
MGLQSFPAAHGKIGGLMAMCYRPFLKFFVLDRGRRVLDR